MLWVVGMTISWQSVKTSGSHVTQIGRNSFDYFSDSFLLGSDFETRSSRHYAVHSPHSPALLLLPPLLAAARLLTPLW